MSWTLCQNVVSLLPIFIIGLFTLAKCDNITTIGEVDAGLNLDLKHDIFGVTWPSTDMKIAFYSYSTTYWVKMDTDDMSLINQRWNCNEDPCLWNPYRDEALKARYRRFKNKKTGQCMRVGDGTLNCEGTIPNETFITPAPCKSYAEDNCQYFSLGGSYISSNQYTYYQLRVNSYAKNICVSAQTGPPWQLYTYTCSNSYNNQWWYYKCFGTCS